MNEKTNLTIILKSGYKETFLCDADFAKKMIDNYKESTGYIGLAAIRHDDFTFIYRVSEVAAMLARVVDSE